MISEITAITTLIGSASSDILTIGNLAKKLKDVISRPKPDPLEMKELVLDIYNKLVDTKHNHSQLENFLLDLQSEIKKVDRFTAQAARYEFAQTDMGGRVYALKKDDDTGEPPHEICANCFEDAIKSILQPHKFNTFICPRCKGTIPKKYGDFTTLTASRTKPDILDGY